MKQLRIIRMVLAILFLVASVACVTLGAATPPAALLAQRSQIILSALSATAGSTLVWIVITLLFGRVYCSTVCPVGTVSDIFLKIRNRIPRLATPFRYTHPSRISAHILWVYILCIIIGVMGIPYLIEPWNIMRNLGAIVNVSAIAGTWLNIGMSALAGIMGGVTALLLVALLSLWRGREFCTSYCPVGKALGLLSEYSMYHIEIDRDKCSSCGLCEDICRSSCIKTVSRYVDNSRCVRCFDCVAKCPDQAVRFQINRNRPASPLMTRVKKIDKT